MNEMSILTPYSRVPNTPLRNYYDYKFYEHMSFRSLIGTNCLNPMRYHGVSIENIYCYHPPSIMTQSVRIYHHIRITSIG